MSAGKTPPTRPAALREWAAERLEVPADSTPEQARHAFLAQLAEHDFVPYEGRFEAWQMFGERSAAESQPEPDGFATYFENALAAAVEDFAAGFFELPPTERRARWDELRVKSEASFVAVSRLNALTAGLDVVPPPATDDELHNAIVRTACRLHVLDPLRKASVERTFWGDAAKNAALWEMASRRLCESHPELIGLAPRYFERLKALRKKLSAEDDERKQRNSDEHAAKRREATSHSGGVNWVWVIVVGIAVVAPKLFRACDSPSTHNRRTPAFNTSPAPHSYAPSQSQIAKWFNATDEELEQSRDRAAMILFGLEESRREYRAKLQEIDDAYLGVGSLDGDSYATDHPDASLEELLDWRLKALRRQLEVTQLEARYLYPKDASNISDDQGLRTGATVASIMLRMRQTEQQLQDLRSGTTILEATPNVSIEPTPSLESTP